MAPGSGGEILTSGGGRVDAEGRFTFASVTPDTYQFVVTWNASGARDKWTIKSSTANGRETFEAPLRVNPGEPLEWTVTFTDRPTSLAGVLQDRSGRAATDYFILVFSSDRRHWTPGSRRVRMTRPATDGTFSVKGLPPGESRSPIWNRASGTIPHCSSSSSRRRPGSRCTTARRRRRISGLGACRLPTLQS